MTRAVEFRTEARRLRHALGRLTEPSLNRAMSSASPAIQRNIDHCRSMLAKGIDDRANRQLVETLLRYMETSVAGAGRSPSNHEHDALQASVTADEKRLKIVARELQLAAPPTNWRRLEAPFFYAANAQILISGNSATLLFTRPHPAILPDGNIAPTPLREAVALIEMSLAGLKELAKAAADLIRQ